MAKVSLINLTKKFGDVIAVNDLSLEINDKELVVLVGPSGCGKTTTLRIIAGLENVSSGQVIIGDRSMTNVPPYKRNIAMVFQNFALYPHMTAYENIAFSLEVEKLHKSEVRRRVEKLASMLEIESLLDRRPGQLSGGQKQRVALGRAIIRNPSVLLMDEPLSNLDAQLRVLMRSELKKLTRDLMTTTIYVTHDQVEAMTMGDRIVVMNEGQIQQEDTPYVVYNRPANLFVSKLIGSPAMNLFEAEIRFQDGSATLIFGNTSISLTDDQSHTLKDIKFSGGKLIAGIRPEAIRVEYPGTQLNGRGWSRAQVAIVEPQGSDTVLNLKWNLGSLVARVNPELSFQEGENVVVSFPAGRLCLFDPTTQLLVG